MQFPPCNSLPDNVEGLSMASSKALALSTSRVGCRKQVLFILATLVYLPLKSRRPTTQAHTEGITALGRDRHCVRLSPLFESACACVLRTHWMQWFFMSSVVMISHDRSHVIHVEGQIPIGAQWTPTNQTHAPMHSRNRVESKYRKWAALMEPLQRIAIVNHVDLVRIACTFCRTQSHYLQEDTRCLLATKPNIA